MSAMKILSRSGDQVVCVGVFFFVVVVFICFLLRLKISKRLMQKDHYQFQASLYFSVRLRSKHR